MAATATGTEIKQKAGVGTRAAAAGPTEARLLGGQVEAPWGEES
jgi:hypothetical protein